MTRSRLASASSVSHPIRRINQPRTIWRKTGATAARSGRYSDKSEAEGGRGLFLFLLLTENGPGRGDRTDLQFGEAIWDRDDSVDHAFIDEQFDGLVSARLCP